MIASALSLPVELIYGPHRPSHLASFYRLQTCLGFLLLLHLLALVVHQIQLSNVVELQQHSPISNNTSVTTYVHRMIISPPCLFKQTKNDQRVAMLSHCLLDHTQQTYFCLISLLRNNVSKSVYINLKHSVLRVYCILMLFKGNHNIYCILKVEVKRK